MDLRSLRWNNQKNRGKYYANDMLLLPKISVDINNVKNAKDFFPTFKTRRTSEYFVEFNEKSLRNLNKKLHPLG